MNFRKVCTFSLNTWDISLTLNMTYFFIRHSERSEESHNLSEEYILRTFSVGYFANAQYDVLFAFPEGESEVGFTVFAKERSDCGNLPGGWFSAKYIFRTYSVGYFACAQYDVLFAFSFGESGLQAQRSKTIGDKSVR